MARKKPTNPSEIVEKFKALNVRVLELENNITQEYDAAVDTYKEALKASMRSDSPEPEAPDPYLNRFSSFKINYLHYRGSALAFIGMALNKLGQAELSDEQKSKAYKTLIEQGQRVADHFSPAALAVLHEIREHPERVKPGEEALRDRIVTSLEEMITLCNEMGSAAKELQAALGIGSGEGRARGSNDAPRRKKP